MQEELSVLELEASADFACWVALAVAPWAGVAAIDFRAHSFVFVSQTGEGDARHVISITCSARTERTSFVQVRAHRVSATHPEASARDLAKEQEIRRLIAAALTWDRDHWQELNLPSKYSAVSRNITFDVYPRRSRRLRLNGIEIPLRRGQAVVSLAQGPYLIEVEEPSEDSDLGVLAYSGLLYHAQADQLPNLFVFANALAEGAPTILADVLVSPVEVPPGIRGLIGRIGGTLLGRAVIVVGAVLGAIEIGKAAKVIVDTKIIERDNEDSEKSCCCIWKRTEHYSGFVMDDQGRVNQGIELYSRGFTRTAPRAPDGSCLCGDTPNFPPTTVRSANIFRGQEIRFEGGPPTSGPRTAPKMRCPHEGYSGPFFTEGYIVSKKGE